MYLNNKFIEIMKHFPKEILKKSVLKFDGDRYRKNFKCYDQLVAMIFGQLSGSNSLREIEYGFNSHRNSHYHLCSRAVSKSTLSDANNRTNPKIFMEVCRHLMAQVPSKVRKETSDIIEIIDSSPINLRSSGCDDWTLDKRTRCLQGVKLHIGYAPDTESPIKADFSDSNINDLTKAKEWPIEPGRTYVFDKGYYDYNWWNDIVNKGSHFVTRLKKDAAIKVVKSLPSVGSDILQDEEIIFKYRYPRGGKKNNYTKPLRRIVVERPYKETPLVLVTDRFDLTAQQVADLYKERWSIELFFKWIKQRLKIKKFIGKSKNAIFNQIIAALITYLLMLIYKKLSQIKCSMHEFIIKIKSTLFCTKENYYNKKRRKNKMLDNKQMELKYV